MACALPSDVFVQLGHARPVQSLALSPDEKWMAVVDLSGALVLWDVTSRREYRRLQAASGIAMFVEFLPQAERIAWISTHNGGGTLTISDLDGNTLAQTEALHRARIVGMAVDRDGHLYTADENGLLVRWKDDLSGVDRNFDTGLSKLSTLSLNGDRLFAGTREGRILFFDLSAANVPASAQILAVGSEPVSDIALSSAGLMAVSMGSVSGSAVQHVRLFDAAGSPLRDLDAGIGRIAALTFSTDGSQLAAMTDINLGRLKTDMALDGHESVTIWTTKDGVIRQRLVREKNRHGVPAFRGRLHFSKDGQRIFMAGWDESPRMWPVNALRGEGQTFHGYGLALKEMARLGGTQLVTADFHATPYNGMPQSFEDYVAEFGGAKRWGDVRMTQARKTFSSMFQGPSKSYSLARWDLQSGQLERIEPIFRSAINALVSTRDGGVAALSVMMPEFVGMPPLRADLLREVKVVPDEQAQVLHFGALPIYQKTDPFDATLTEWAGQISGYIEQAALSASGLHAAVIVKLTEGEKERRELAVFQRSTPDIAAEWMLLSRLVLDDFPVGLALSSDGSVVWVSGAHVDKAATAMVSAVQQRWLWAVSASDAKVLGKYDPGEGFPAKMLVPFEDGRAVAISGGAEVRIVRIGQPGSIQSLALPAAETLIRAIAVSPDNRSLAAATANGTYLWDLESATYTAQLPADTMVAERLLLTERLLLSTHDDGSVSVRLRKTGELLARLLRFSNGEWLSMTPEGYFAGSAKGDQAVNVRVGRSVFGIDQFYDVFYRPDIVQRKLSGQNIKSLVRITLDDAIKNPPPQTAMKSVLSENGSRLQLDVEALTAGGGVGQIRIYHNGKLVQLDGDILHMSAPHATSKGVIQDAAELTRVLSEQVVAAHGWAAQAAVEHRRTKALALNLVPGDNTIAVVATNADGSIASRPLVLDVPSPQKTVAGRVHVVSIGIDHFSHARDISPLAFARKDADDLHQALVTNLRKSDPNRRIAEYRLRDAQATSDGVQRLIAKLKKSVRPTDVVFWFVASHGLLDAQGQYAIVLNDWQVPAQGLLRADEILDASRDIQALRQIFILDTCHAGGLDSTMAGFYDARLSVLARNMGLHLLASANATEQALDGYRNNGLFTHTLLKGLKQEAKNANGDDWISISELSDYARAETTRIARLLRHSQKPISLHYGNDVPVVRLVHSKARAKLQRSE